MMKKKKGRPSLRKSNLEQQQQEEETLIAPNPNPNFNSPSRRSKPNINGISPVSDWISGGDDDDDERKEKKVKLVVRLPSLSLNSASNGSDSNADGEKPQINAAGDRSGDLSTADQVKMVKKATDNLHGSPLESGPTTPLPDKKLLLFILDRLQKKDTHAVFSEPVDPNELPDYHEIIEHPMDFGTVRQKLDEGRYSNLDEFEADVFLICSNAMQYNAPDTIYFRQARSIQDLAKRDFENLRQVNDDGEPQPRIVKRGRPPGKNLKKILGTPSFDRVGPESSSDATLATVGDNAMGSNSYNLRKGPMSLRVRSNDAFLGASHPSRNTETYSEWLSELNSEFPASILKAEAKHAKKQAYVDENRRATYRSFHRSAFGHDPPALTSLNGDTKQLMAVGLHSEHGYARSLARFAANLGPVVWKIASKKIERVLPPGEKFGPGWVGENEASPQPPPALLEQKSSNNSVHEAHSLGVKTPSMASVVTHQSSLPCKEDTVEAVSGQNSNTASLRSGAGGVVDPGRASLQTLQKHMLHSDRNGFNGVSGYDLSSQTGTARVKPSVPTGPSGFEEASVPSPMLSRSNNGGFTPQMAANPFISESNSRGKSTSYAHYESVSAPPVSAPDSHTAPEASPYGAQTWQGGTPSQHRLSALPVPPDLNVRFQAPGSPTSSFRVGSPQQPDLALQL